MQAAITLFSIIARFQETDIRILHALNNHRLSALDPLFVFLTNSAAYLAFGVPAIMLITALAKKNPPLSRNALLILFSVLASALLANILKYSINLPRPYEIYPFIEKLSVGGSPSFPSGHTADAFAFAFSLSLVYRKKYLAIPVFVWACLVGYSRMVLGVHFPSDVLAGAIIGIGCAFFCKRIVNHCFRER